MGKLPKHNMDGEKVFSCWISTMYEKKWQEDILMNYMNSKWKEVAQVNDKKK